MSSVSKGIPASSLCEGAMRAGFCPEVTLVGRFPCSRALIDRCGLFITVSEATLDMVDGGFWHLRRTHLPGRLRTVGPLFCVARFLVK